MKNFTFWGGVVIFLFVCFYQTPEEKARADKIAAEQVDLYVTAQRAADAQQR
jgi:hypothetical protein